MRFQSILNEGLRTAPNSMAMMTQRLHVQECRFEAGSNFHLASYFLQTFGRLARSYGDNKLARKNFVRIFMSLDALCQEHDYLTFTTVWTCRSS